jgi:hypothetical protein
MNWIVSWVARHPKAALVLGKAVFLAGGILVIGAVFARAALGNLNADRVQAGQSAVYSLAQAFPQYPTWVVPEGPVGFVISAALVLVGLALVILAEKARPRR